MSALLSNITRQIAPAFIRIPELRNKILLTLMLLMIYRIGFQIPLPIIDQAVLAEFQQSAGSDGTNRLFSTVAMFGGTQLGMSTIFGLGIMPYISASIIFQLLTNVIPQLEQLSKEGESGRKKINEYTRYATVLICLVQSFFWINYLISGGLGAGLVPIPYQGTGYVLACVVTMTAGTVFLMWIGEQIDQFGIGNGISMLIMAGILAQMPAAIFQLAPETSLELDPQDSQYGIITILILGAMFLAVILGVVLITESQRRIPTQSAKHARGGRMAATGPKQYLPLKVNQAGVMPIIFASSLLMFPYMVFQGLSGVAGSWIDYESGSEAGVLGQAWAGFVNFLGATIRGGAYSFQNRDFFYMLCYIVLIYFFCYFWTAITFNPKDIADNLKDYGSFIPGYRPGKPTANYLEKVMLRITFVGAAFLSIVAVIPTLVQNTLNIPFIVAQFLGGTGLLIVVSVCLDLVQKIDSHLIMRNYPSILNKR